MIQDQQIIEKAQRVALKRAERCEQHKKLQQLERDERELLEDFARWLKQCNNAQLVRVWKALLKSRRKNVADLDEVLSDVLRYHPVIKSYIDDELREAREEFILRLKK